MEPRKKLTNTEMDKIIRDKLLGVKTENQIANEVGCSVTTVGNVWAAVNAVKSGDVERMKHVIRTSATSLNCMKYAADVYGATLPPIIYEVCAEKNAKRKKREPAQETLPEPEEKEPEKSKNDCVYFIRILEELHEQNELLKSLIDTVIPHYIQDMKDNNNLNADMLDKTIREGVKALECIKANTRKRGL